MTAAGQAFSVSVAPDGALLVSGEIDVASADGFLDAAVSIADRTREVVLDLTKLVFIDSAGLVALVRLAEEACPHGVVLASPQDNVMQVLDILHIEEFARIRVKRRDA
ncbi:MAG TPA: STAS domain-containing protein [Actinomycetota bacterium]|nr:STAS domain-containing protein [Actinomycetota bacterium]